MTSREQELDFRGGETLSCPDPAARPGVPLIDCHEVTVTGRLTVPTTLALSGGSRLLVTGPNGAGKSTLPAVPARALEPSAGEVRHRAEARVAHLEGTC